jgi:CheY-like chemotaxis protein
VVAEEEPLRKLIVRLLERRGFVVSEAETGESALPLVRKLQPSVVICDADGQGMSGVELYRTLADTNGATAPRFLFLAGDKGAVDRGGLDVPLLVKPFTATDLEQALAKAGVGAPSPPSP